MGSAARRDAEKLLAGLQSGKGPADPRQAGDPTMLPPSMERATPQEISNTFGDAFAADVESRAARPVGRPFESAYGLHLVRVAPGRRRSSRRSRRSDRGVLREWQAAQRQQVNDAFYDSLRRKYDVRYEGEIGKPRAVAGFRAARLPRRSCVAAAIRAARRAACLARTAARTRCARVPPDPRGRGGDVRRAWKVPANGEYRLGMYVRLPKECTGPPRPGTMVGRAFVERWRASCPDGLTGKWITSTA